MNAEEYSLLLELTVRELQDTIDALKFKEYDIEALRDREDSLDRTIQKKDKEIRSLRKKVAALKKEISNATV